MDQFQQMTAFVRVSETRNFSGVARELNISQSSVSKQIAGLEQRLGARLLNRSTRSITLTEEGAIYYEHCLAILDAVSEADASITATRTFPSGTLRLACPLSFGTLEIAPLLPRLLVECPNLNIELVMSDRFVDLVEEGIDLAIRVSDLTDSSLISRRIGTAGLLLVASPEYLDGRGRPKTLKDLQDHNCLINTGFSTFDRWHFIGTNGPVSVKVKGNLRANNSETLLAATLEGVGIGLIPTWLANDNLADSRLETVLPDLFSNPVPIHALYPSRRFVPAKVRFTIDALKNALEAKT